MIVLLLSHLGLLEMARYPNVYCKASGMFATDPKWDQKSVDTVVKPLFEIFGFDRLGRFHLQQIPLLEMSSLCTNAVHFSKFYVVHVYLRIPWCRW